MKIGIDLDGVEKNQNFKLDTIGQKNKKKNSLKSIF